MDSGELYVAEGRVSGGDPSLGRLDKFNASTGAFIGQFPRVPSLSYLYQGVAVGHSTGETEVYIGADKVNTTEGVMAVFSSAGALQATWEGRDTPANGFGCFNCGGQFKGGVAVDNSGNPLTTGDVYVSAPRQGVVDVFEPKAGGGESYVTQLTGPEPGVTFKTVVHDVAVDQLNGDVLVVEEEAVDVFEPTVLGYTLVRRLAGTPSGAFEGVSGVAVDGSNGDIYVTAGSVVDQFSSAGAYLGELTGVGTPAGAFGKIDGVAVDPATQEVYVNAQEGEHFVVDVFGRNVVTPDVTTAPVSNLKARSALLNGTVNPDEAGQATCRFEWGTSTSFGQVAPCEPEAVANGGSPVEVHAELGGLQPDTTYYYRLQASNTNGTNPGETFQDQHFTTTGPGVREPSASSVTSTSATLDASINPNSASTSYYFQYGTSGSYGVSVPAPPGVSLGSGAEALSVSVHLQGLFPATVYHYRVVALSEPNGEPVTVESPDEMFTTQAEGTEVALPDGRAWEMVSPPDKHGAGFDGVGVRDGEDIQAAAGGGAVTYSATAPSVANPAGSRTPEVEQMFSTRAAPGSWGTADIATPHDEVAGVHLGNIDEYKLFSSDLSLGIVEPQGDTPLPPLPAGSERTLYFREASGAYRALVTSANVPPGTEFGGQEEERGFVFVSASSDLNHVVVDSNVALEEGAPSRNELYEWAEGRMRLASVLPGPGGEPASNRPLLGARGEGGSAYGDVRHTVSNDGSRIVWSEDRKKSGGELYLRDMVRGETVRVDATQGAPEPAGGIESRYWTANGEGSRVFFTSPERLTASSTEGGSGDLYVFEVTSGAGEPLAGRLVDLTVDPHAGETASVQGVIGASEDGSYVYFVAGGALGGAAVNGAGNLYVEHYEAATRTWAAPTFIAALANGDGNTWSIEASNDNLYSMTSRVSPNGRYLAFMSAASLTGYENRDASSGVPDQEVFLYDASTGRLVCASCDPTGARPVGVVESGHGLPPLWDAAGLWGGRWVAGNVPGWTPVGLGSALYQSRYLSDSGRLFFNSSDALVPGDVNGKVDVYEYEPAGEGGCRPPGYGVSASVVYSASAGGCVGLVSAGTSSQEAAFLDASEKGGDVFFLTASQLSPLDYDQSYDVYDAHECTAVSPCAPPPALSRPPCTTGDACKAAPAPQPTLFGAPSSETFSGAGNVTPSPPAVGGPKGRSVRCGRGAVKRRGVCVRKKRQRKRVGSKRAAKTNRRVG